jgi:hypothetical protein
MRTKYLILTLCTALLMNLSEAQRRSSYYKLDVGGYLGLANYLGEIGGKEKTERPFIWDMKLNQTRWSMGGFARYKFNDYFAIQGSLNYLRIQGDDKLSTNRGRRGRNLNFRNDILDFAIRGEVYIYNIPDVGGTGRYRLDFKSYAFVGVGAFLHGPKTIYEGSWVKLRDLKTEGQATPYSKIGVCIPVGLGFYFTKKRKYRIGWEMSWRLTFTDYIDDISTVYADPSLLESQAAIDLANRRDELGDDPSVPHEDHYRPHTEDGVMVFPKRGDSNDNDTYFYMGFSYSYVFRGKNTFYSQNYNWIGGRGKRDRVKVKF